MALAGGNRCAVLLFVAPLTGASNSTVPLITSAIRKSPKGPDHDYDPL
jgi:hypothetical protein